ncbi:hypothetical protein KC19_8G045900 [Ceratodon purpureus]|uniref:Uncharacterized protein n=1 Tax=Ceratodon purpureus TaxID=3225 RepID=A0A8T0GV52_CERPU|nr:hypothetical protein KC19_8G045900 [Ceratodon purpureus]
MEEKPGSQCKTTPRRSVCNVHATIKDRHKVSSNPFSLQSFLVTKNFPNTHMTPRQYLGNTSAITYRYPTSTPAKNLNISSLSSYLISHVSKTPSQQLTTNYSSVAIWL